MVDLLGIGKEVHDFSNHTLDSTKKIAGLFEDKWNICLNQASTKRALTHFLHAVDRIIHNKEIKPINNEILSEVKEHENYFLALTLFRDMERTLGFKIPKDERDYMLVNNIFLVEH